MPTRIKLTDGQFSLVEDPYTHVSDDEDLVRGDLIISLTRFQSEGERLLSEGRAVGVRLEPAEEVEVLAYDLPRIAVVAVAFPKFNDGRAYTAARLLRERYGFKGEIRAIGDVLRDQFFFMQRCGFDTIQPKAGKYSDAQLEESLASLKDFSAPYQAAIDQPEPLFRRAQRSA